ncbi:hypothetical protein PAXRUDRAFT_37050 [Paxillus rubicundulus Ve08.2h10]|uniref:Uncharacterized protein n=1 Tax=Paxillus rubicundulus Ve08.2h10 TaxID=930991 RepID=A0A0D0D2K2_9AGAM|nr:hypothetical protein PAXRUDRAFT_37050 [Paxillus rubicundulus Ve08.2h10]
MSSQHGIFNQKLSVCSTLLMCSAPLTPMTSHSIQAAAGPTSHNNTIALHTGFLTQALQSASTNCCLDIIKAPQGPFYHKLIKVFDNVTPEEYNTLSLLTSKDHRYCFSAKLIYHPDLSQIVAMVPYEIHEITMNNFSKHVCNLLQPFQLSDDMDVMAIVIPDFHLSLCSLHNYGGQALIPWWVSECGFSSTVTTMLCQLDFNHTTSVVTLDPVVMGGVTWVENKLIKLHISVFPNMQMDTVNQLLNLATKCLFLKIASMMEEWYNQLPPVNNSNDLPPGGPGGPGPGGLGPGGPGVPGPPRKQPSTPKPSPSRK